ncbi:serine hydrolase [Streptomyces collinus]|uniref:serine hydrolase n=1 Tax=Streptomyces collinus TaxID=42684 RepID=UPI0037A1BCA9
MATTPATAAPAPATAAPAPATARHDHDDIPRHGLGPALTERLDRAVAEVREQAGIPGVVVGLWMPGRGSYVRATGVADTVTRMPMTADSCVRIGSETKTFTVTALLRLADDGRIGHNGSIPGYETVTVYLPSQQATLVIMINTDVVVEGQEPSTLLARAITAVATPDHAYDGSVVTRP